MVKKKSIGTGTGGIMPSLPYSKAAASIIKEFKLSPIALAEGVRAAKAVRLPGIPAAHIHFKDQVYPVNNKQWKEFSTRLMAEFQTKMGKARTVSFDQLQKLSEAVDNLSK